jgi:hypothetical protein
MLSLQDSRFIWRDGEARTKVNRAIPALACLALVVCWHKQEQWLERSPALEAALT